MKELGNIQSYIFNNKILLVIDSRWIDYFNSGEPTFKAIIENGKYILVGPKVNRQGPTPEPSTQETDTL